MGLMMKREKKSTSRASASAVASDASRNVFADLNLPNPEEWKIKAELARQISALVKSKTQVETARLLGVHQPDVSALLRGKLQAFSTERLMSFLRSLGQQ